jgi:hypothetical protein
MLSYKKAPFIIFLLCVFVYAPAQQVSYVAFKDNDTVTKNSLTEIKKKYDREVALLDGKDKKYIAEVFKERYDLIIKQFSENGILTATEPLSYLTALTNEILKNNPTLKLDGLRVLFSKSYHANALSMGEGTIFFNIGLFHRLQNESQAVFVLCHELAHYFLNHGNNNIHQYVSTINSPEFQQKLKSIQKSSYQQNRQLEALAENLLFRNRRHGREFEHAADSMALELMRNTNYDVKEALTCLSLLDSADKEKYNHNLDLEKLFNFSSFSFKRSWLENDALVIGKSVDNEKHRDSLKTHPDCSKRIEVLQPKVNQYQKTGSKKFIVSETKFNELKRQFDYEIIDHCMRSGKISKALYYALTMIQIYPTDCYVTSVIGQCLNNIYINQKNHTLGKIVDLPNPDFNQNYNQLLQMIQNLRLREVAALSFNFLKEREQQFSCESFNNVYNQSKINFNQ